LIVDESLLLSIFTVSPKISLTSCISVAIELSLFFIDVSNLATVASISDFV